MWRYRFWIPNSLSLDHLFYPFWGLVDFNHFFRTKHSHHFKLSHFTITLNMLGALFYHYLLFILIVLKFCARIFFVLFSFSLSLSHTHTHTISLSRIFCFSLKPNLHKFLFKIKEKVCFLKSNQVRWVKKN